MGPPRSSRRAPRGMMAGLPRGSTADAAKTARSCVYSRVAELFFDPDQLVVLGEPVGASERAGLDLTAIGGDGEVGDRCVLGFARAVAHHRRIACAMRD